MSKSKLVALGDRVIVKVPEAKEQTKGGIYIPESVQKDGATQEGTVISVGKGKFLDNGTIRPMLVKEGDKVIFGKYSGSKIKIDDEEVVCMREDDIMAVEA
jgi:chaperonin GroES